MNIEMTVVYCARCHIPFALTDNLIDRLRKSHENFKCPMGHGNIYSSETEEEKLRKKLLEKSRQLMETEIQLKELQDSKKKKMVKRTKKTTSAKSKKVQA